MPGRFLYDGLRPAHLERVGRVIARVHEVSLALDLPADFSRQPWDARGLLGPGSIWGDTKYCIFLGEDDREWTAREAARVRALLESYGTGPDRFGLIHADLHYGNILFHRDGPRLVDFDDCGPGFLAHDLRTPIHGNDKPFARESILSGYAQVRPLPPDLDRILPILSQAQRLRSIGWLATRSDNPRLRSIAVDGIPKILEATREKANSIG
jgi:Ser/Thr protein kinase RdoA (MazF antagonist)